MKEVRSVLDRIRGGWLKEVIPGTILPLELPPCSACHMVRVAQRFESNGSNADESKQLVQGVALGDGDRIFDKACAFKEAKKKDPSLTWETYEAGLVPVDEKLVPLLYIYKRAVPESPNHNHQ